ncbi:hypothetical protein MBOL_20610 [Mycobacteroides abscessus subsp. bolletii BD]|nr:hypothetical protein MBOL_20610 [Mycobacteroides abscessus subsp. bolletii BD]
MLPVQYPARRYSSARTGGNGTKPSSAGVAADDAVVVDLG